MAGTLVVAPGARKPDATRPAAAKPTTTKPLAGKPTPAPARSPDAASSPGRESERGAPAGLPRFLQSTPAPAAGTPVPAARQAAGARRGGEPDRAAPRRAARVSGEPDLGEAGAAANGSSGPVSAGDIRRAPATPAEDPEFQSATRQVRVEAARQRHHDPQDKKRREMEDAAALAEGDQVEQSAKERNTGAMERVGAKQQAEGQRFSAEQFKTDFKALVNGQEPPRTEQAVKAFANDPPVRTFPQALSDGIATKQGEVTRPLQQQAVPRPGGGVVEKTAVKIPALVPTAAPQRIEPRQATPKPRTDEEISVKRESDRLDQAMEDNRLSDDQLAESREPSFIETLQVKQEAARQVADTPGVYRQQEAAILQAAEGGTDQSLTGRLGGMNAVSRRAGGTVHGGQHATETRTEKRQREIKTAIDDIYKSTVEGVTAVLTGMATQVKDQFAGGLKRQTERFNREVRRRISDYYGDWRIDDALFGPADVVVLPDGSTRSMTLDEVFGHTEVKRINPEVYVIFVEEKNRFVAAMDGELDAIAEIVQAGLSAAHLLIQLGQLNITLFKETLKGEEREYADQLEEEVRLKFESLEASIDDARADLLKSLAESYTENVKQLETTFNEINDELKKSWIDLAVDFIKTVGKTIFQLADLLFSILVRVAYLVWDIIKHPIRFFETLVSGLMQGIGEFVGNIGTYMQEAFWSWITGATPARNIRLSAASGLESLFDLVVQVLALGPADLRAIAEKVLGREFMEVVDRAMALGEKALEPLTILLTQGPVAFWVYLQETLAEIIQSSFERIKESVFYAFVEKALKWIAGFFIPGGGFVKIVKAIFKAFQFVAENLERIRAFFDSVFDSMEAATQGNAAGVASKIITGLKMGVVLALDFLAKQLGLDSIVGGVQKVIQALRRPIVNGIEWILRKVRPLVMTIMRRLGLGGREEPRAGAVPVAGPPDGQIGKTVAFSAAGESHRLWIVQKGANAVVMMASAPRPVAKQLEEYEEMAHALGDETRRAAAAQQIAQARQLLGRLDSEADTLAREISSPRREARGESREFERQDRAVESDEDLLAAQLVRIREALGLAEPQPGTEEAAGDVRDRVTQALARELTPEHTWADTLALVDGLAARFQPAGLRSLTVVPDRSGDEAVILAEASARAPAARLRRKAPKPRGRSVTAHVELHLTSSADVPAGGFAPVGGVPSVATAGRVLAPARRAPEVVRVETWNTSNLDFDRIGNESHAEHQFAQWIDARRELMPLIGEITVRVAYLMPCSGCAGDLAILLETIRRLQERAGSPVLRRADLAWSRFYEGTLLTASWQDVRRLSQSGWSLHAPLDAYPPEQSETRGALKLVEQGVWSLEGASLAPRASRTSTPPREGDVPVASAVLRRR